MKFQWPVKYTPFVNVYIGQPFGGHNRDYGALLGHPGIDFMADEGTPVFAVCDGWLYQSGETMGDYGKHIYQWYEEDGFQYVIPYGHFSKRVFPDISFGFNKNIPIKRGQLVGFVGSTGYSNANHVHIGKYQYQNYQLTNLGNGYAGALDFTADLLPREDFIGYMSNVIFAHKAGTQEYGFWVPATSPETLKDKALNYDLHITKSDGSVDFAQAKEINGL